MCGLRLPQWTAQFWSLLLEVPFAEVPEDLCYLFFLFFFFNIFLAVSFESCFFPVATVYEKKQELGAALADCGLRWGI